MAGFETLRYLCKNYGCNKKIEIGDAVRCEIVSATVTGYGAHFKTILAEKIVSELMHMTESRILCRSLFFS